MNLTRYLYVIYVWYHNASKSSAESHDVRAKGRKEGIER